MAGMSNLRNVLELIIDRLNPGSLADQQLIHQRQQPIGHIVVDWGNQLQLLVPQLLKQDLIEVAPVTDQLAPQLFGQRGYGSRSSTLTGVRQKAMISP